MITIVDYGMGNIGSIANMIAKVGGTARRATDLQDLRDATKLVLPGVGHFDRGGERLDQLGLRTILTELVLERRVPILGICLGMQLMCRGSEEGNVPGLGWIDADVRRFDPATRPVSKVPHMGWNVAKTARENPLLPGSCAEPQRFYFVHSFYVDCHVSDDVVARTDYGGEFCSAFAHDNIWGVQFHPEKSHAFGMALFRRFIEL